MTEAATVAADVARAARLAAAISVDDKTSYSPSGRRRKRLRSTEYARAEVAAAEHRTENGCHDEPLGT